jgi:CRISPR-associated protein Cas5h
VGIAPLETVDEVFHENGNFPKTIIRYNNSTGMASDETGGNLMITEQTLVAPAYRCYILLNESNTDHKTLHQNLFNYRAEFLPYLGKNECSVWWDNTKEHKFEPYKPDGPFKISSIFIKEESLKDGVTRILFELGMGRLTKASYMYFENLPIGYIGKPLYQYEYRSFAFGNFDLKEQYRLPDEYPLLKLNNDYIIQVF